VPPLTVKSAAPVFPALHKTFVPEIDAVSTAGSVIVTDAVAVQPLLSVMVTV
jgi:hypothetical protein